VAAMRVLIVEDNPDVRSSLTRILARAGVTVDEAENGLVALVRIQHADYDAIVCDIMMPVLDGVRLYEVMTHLYPGAAARVVFASAWLDDPEVRAFLDRTDRPVLRKPFDIERFLDTVRRVAQSTDADVALKAGPG
jgi:CheY-like chemotaxis protein